MRALSILSIASVVLVFASCHKNKIEQQQDILAWLNTVKDSSSYTIDGKNYICDHLGSTGWGNQGMNLDTSHGHWKWDPDSVLYSTAFRFYAQSYIITPGYLELVF